MPQECCNESLKCVRITIWLDICVNWWKTLKKWEKNVMYFGHIMGVQGCSLCHCVAMRWLSVVVGLWQDLDVLSITSGCSWHSSERTLCPPPLVAHLQNRNYLFDGTCDLLFVIGRHGIHVVLAIKASMMVNCDKIRVNGSRRSDIDDTHATSTMYSFNRIRRVCVGS